MPHNSITAVLENNNAAALLTSLPILIKHIVHYGNFTWEINAE